MNFLTLIFLPQLIRVPAVLSVFWEQVLYATGQGVPANLKRMTQAELQYAYDIAADDHTRATIKQHMN